MTGKRCAWCNGTGMIQTKAIPCSGCQPRPLTGKHIRIDPAQGKHRADREAS